MLFSILISLLSSAPQQKIPLLHIALPFLEITNGIPMLCAADTSCAVRFVLTLSLTAFGGACSQKIPLLHIALPFLEITNGIPMLCAADTSCAVRFVLTLSLTAFGGACSIAQTNCMLEGTGLSIFPYFLPLFPSKTNHRNSLWDAVSSFLPTLRLALDLSRIYDIHCFFRLNKFRTICTYYVIAFFQ